MTAARAFKLGRAFAWVTLFSIFLIPIGLFLVIAFATDVEIASEGGRIAEILSSVGIITLLVSGLSLTVTTIGTASTILLGWRADRRQATELGLRLEQLELQLAEARARASQPDAPSN